MTTEKEKMLKGLLYDASDAELSLEREKTRKLLHCLNTTAYGNDVFAAGNPCKIIKENINFDKASGYLRL